MDFQNEMGTQSTPTFTPPEDILKSSAPIFTPPAPTFAPPTTAVLNANACYFHQDEEAVTQCAKCGKNICQDCADNYGVSVGQYAGQVLCYDCCQKIVADNVAELTKNKAQINKEFKKTYIGAGIGFVIGAIYGMPGGFFASLLLGLIYGGIGGVFLDAVKGFFVAWWNGIKHTYKTRNNSTDFIVGVLFSGIGAGIGVAFRAVIETTRNIIDYSKYLKKTSGFIESDTEALQQMKDYMEFTLVCSQNKGVDIETLLQDESQLANNAYAHMVQTQGEEQAEANMRKYVASINENGEIIRSFAA